MSTTDGRPLSGSTSILDAARGMEPHSVVGVLAACIALGHDVDTTVERLNEHAMAARQPRENAVPCDRCKRSTWNHDRICDACNPNYLPTDQATAEADRAEHEVQAQR